jgi:hypothetical protein
MFAKLAHFGRFGRTHEARFATSPANDNLLPRLVGSSRRPRRNVLVCHWHRTPSRALECVWSVEDEDTGGAAASGPQLCRPNGPPLLLAV